MKSKGFTLIELIIVMAVFLFVIGAAIGIFISIIQNQKRVLAEQQLLNQISYIEEYMSKAIRMASVDTLDTDPGMTCLPPGYIYLLRHHNLSIDRYQGIKFINQSDGNACQEFFLEDGILKEIKNNGDAVALNSTNLIINSIIFSINRSNGSPSGLGCEDPNQCGASNQDSIQPRVTILLKVSIPNNSSKISTTCNSDADCSNSEACNPSTLKCVPAKIIQTTVSQRNLNVNNGQRQSQ